MTSLRPSRLAAATLLGLALAATAHAQNQPGRPGGRPGAAPGQDAPGGRQFDPARFVERMMQMDADGDGKLTREEIGEGRFAAAFDTADANGDGSLTTEELTVFMETRGPRGGRGGEGGPEGRPGRGPEGAPAGVPAGVPAGPSKEAFHDAMERSGRALRGLRRTKFEADTFERDLMALIELESSLMEARRNASAVPMSDAAKAKFGTDEAAYRKSFHLHMAKAMIATLNVELALLEGDAAKAKELVDGILENRNESHDLFEQE